MTPFLSFIINKAQAEKNIVFWQLLLINLSFLPQGFIPVSHSNKNKDYFAVKIILVFIQERYVIEGMTVCRLGAFIVARIPVIKLFEQLTEIVGVIITHPKANFADIAAAFLQKSLGHR